jgi:glyoxylase-like metal-dependent hydrolase (beta-lactamase superfamily II)
VSGPPLSEKKLDGPRTDRAFSLRAENDLFLLTCGHLEIPAVAFSERPLDDLWNRTTITTTVAVLRRGPAVTLVDCGYARATCEDPHRELGVVHAALLGLVPKATRSIVAQLADAGIAANQVTTIVATHLHVDHIGGFSDFPNAELIVEEREYRAFRTGKNPGYNRKDRELLERAAPRITTWSAQERWTGSAAALEAGYDVHGDGRVRLVALPGHTEASSAVLLDGRLLHVGDAAFQAWEYRKRRASMYGALTAYDRGGYRAGLSAIGAFEDACVTHGISVVTSHDRGQWEALASDGAPS